ncbi:MAG: DNA replication and repair protein RecF [Ruminococcus sp.]|jgi:DNA replication and repair protein RecF|nr:DNA replication and repair protein RecF [Ruminococcus sp.]
MYIKNLKINGFRNLRDIEINFGENTNFITGENGQGKTNILEALWLLTGVKSFRRAKESAFFCNTENLPIEITALFENSQRTQEILLKNDGKKRETTLNGVAIESQSKLFGNLLCVVFSPSDIEIATGSPDLRRGFLDIAISQIKPSYVQGLIRYNHILKQRNACLKSDSIIDTEIWDNQLDAVGASIALYRKTYINALNKTAAEIYAALTGKKETFEAVYQSGVSRKFAELAGDTGSARAIFYYYLKKNSDRDRQYGFTSTGIHRDDLKFLINGKEANLYASQGQNRSAALALKLSQAQLLYEETNEKAVVLLDDVFSELDETRRNFLKESLPGYQKIITGTDKQSYADTIIKSGRIEI